MSRAPTDCGLLRFVGVRWEVLGPETVTIAGRAVALNQRPRAVLLCLLNEPNRSVSWERVAAFLWADSPPKTQRNSVARFVADLRRALGPHGDRIVTQGGGYQVVVRDGELDIDAARSALAEAKRLAEVNVQVAHEQAVIAMDLAGIDPNPWIVELPDSQPVLLRNAETQIEVLDTLAELKLRTGRHGELISVLEHGVVAHPYHERLWAHLAVALHRSGRTADALRACQRLRTELAEIGLEPSEAIHRLETRFVAGAAPDAAVFQRPIPGAPTGRSADLAAIEAALAAYRLVTIVGVVGSGKSLLASAAADDEELAGIAVHRIDLRSLRDATRVVPTVAAAVGVPASQTVTSAEDLAAQLLPVSCLIVLDNCEHLRLECAGLAEALTSAAQGVRVLATCREPLRADSEHVYRLDMLTTRESADGTTASPAAAMFAEAAGLALPDDGIVAPDLDAIEAICETVRGHPLAIELSAGLLADMTPAELRDRLREVYAHSAASPLALVLDVAWESLDLPEQVLLARLSVFAGGCTLAAAEFVSRESKSVAEGLAALSSRGLVSRTVEDRYVLDAPVRDFATSRLSDRRETTVTRDRLTDWLRELTASWGIAELGSIAEPSRVLIPEHANLIEALTHLRDEQRAEELAWFAVRSHGVWINHGMYTEIVRWLTPVVDDTSLSRAVRSAAATIRLEADLTVGNFAMMAPWGEKAIELADGEPHDWIPMVSGFLALLSLVVPMSLSTEELLDMAESAADRSDSRDINTAAVLMRRAQVAHHRRRYDAAVDYFREALALVDAEGRLLLALEMGETISLYLAGRREEALETVRLWKSRVETDEWHYQVDIVRAIIIGGCGEPEEATSALAAALRRQKPIAVWSRADEFQIAFGLLADMRGEPRLSAELLATTLSGSPFLSSIVIEHLVAARGLDADGFRELTLELRSRSFPEGIDRGAASTELELVSWWETGARRAEGPRPRSTSSPT